jgi:hypothetical protein
MFLAPGGLQGAAVALFGEEGLMFRLECGLFGHKLSLSRGQVASALRPYGPKAKRNADGEPGADPRPELPQERERRHCPLPGLLGCIRDASHDPPAPPTERLPAPVP